VSGVGPYHAHRVDDVQLVGLARDGDKDAFAAIYDRYADRIHDFCHSVLRDRHEAADATQDTFLVAGLRLAQLRDPAKLRPWLYAIARNEALRRARRRARVEPRDEVVSGVADPHATPEDQAARGDLRELVWNAAAGLNERDRVLLDLNVRQGLEGEDLAAAIGVEPGHAYVMLTRLRDQVERSLGALLVARVGRDGCEELERLLEPWDGRFSPLWRKRVARHVDGCEVCDERRRTLASPLALLGAVPIVAVPQEVRDRVLGQLELASATGAPLGPDGFPPPLDGGERASKRRWLVGAVTTALVATGAVLLLTRPWVGDSEPVVTVNPVSTTTGVLSAGTAVPKSNPPAPVNTGPAPRPRVTSRPATTKTPTPSPVSTTTTAPAPTTTTTTPLRTTTTSSSTGQSGR
jgi:RNA polymerase sigma factor (sigma-70 family)